MSRFTSRAIIAILVVGTLAACAPASAKPSVAQSHSVPSLPPKPAVSTTPTPAASASPEPPAADPLPANALLRVRGVATGSNGAIADIVETVYLPLAPTAAETSALNTTCTYMGWPSNYPSPAILHADITLTLRAGSPAWLDYSPMGVGLNLTNTAVFTGSLVQPDAVGCSASGPVSIPSTATAIAPVSPASSPAGVLGGEGWYNAFYGFHVTYDGDGESAVAQTVWLSECTLEVSPAAIAGAPKMADWPATTQPTSGYECGFGPLE